MSDVLSPEEISIDRLYDLLKAAYLKPERRESDSIGVHSVSGFRQFVELDSEKKCIRLVALFPLREDRTRAQKLEMLNTLNDRVVFARFSMPEEDVLISDYYIPIGEGLIPLQLLNCLRWMEMASIGAIDNHDKEEIVK